MAVATAYTAINMNNWQFYENTASLVVQSNQITEYLAGGRTTYYYGSGFVGNDDGITNGILNQIQHFLGDAEQYRVTGLSHSAATVSDYLEIDSSGILPFLFGGDDTFNGSSFADQLNGYNGADRMDGKGGADKINGGAGNDTITWGAGDTVNGSTGNDKVKIKSGNLDLVAMTNQSQITNTESVDMTGTNNNTLTVGKADVLDISSSTNTLTVLGNVGDTVDLRGAWVLDGTMSAPGFEFWKLGSAIVKVETELNVV